MENQNNFKRLNYFFAFISFIIPIIWNGFDFINLGGDDTRLYLIKPLNWILNYSSNFFSFTYIGNYPKEIFGLFQNITYLILNNVFYEEFSSATDYAFVSLFCYLSMNAILSDLNLNHSFNTKLLPFFYSMTPLGSMLLFNNGGLWIYVLSVLPLIIRNFYMFIFSGKIKFLLFFLLLSFFFSSVYSIKSIHYSIPIFILITFSYIDKFYNYKKLKIFFINFLKISIIFSICNFHLLVFIYMELSNKLYESLNYLPFSNVRISYFFDNLKYLGDNFNSIFFLTHLNHNLFSKYILYSKFIFLILSLFYLFLIFNSKLILSINKNSLIILICFFIFQNMNYTFFEILFSYLFQNIPFVHMFSNYHSKFTYPFLIILIIFFARIDVNTHLFQSKYIKNFITLIILVITAYGVIGKFNDNSIFQTNDIYANNNLNNDYFEVLEVIKNNESIYSYGNIFQIPISREYDLYLDNNIGYVGPSLIQPYIGIKHIINNDYSNLNKEFIKDFQKSILERRFNDFLKSLNSKNITYIIMNKNDLFDLRYYLINYNFYNENLSYINKFLSNNKLKLLFENNSYKIFFLKNYEKNCQYKLINTSIIKIDKNSICGAEKKIIVEKVLRDTNSNIKFVYNDWVNISDNSKYNFVLKNLFRDMDRYNYIINKNDLIFKISSIFSFFCYILLLLYSILFFVLKKNES